MDLKLELKVKVLEERIEILEKLLMEFFKGMEYYDDIVKSKIRRGDLK